MVQVHPRPATVISSSEVVEHIKQILAVADRIYEGFTLQTSGASLDITVDPGTSYIQGYEVGDPDLDGGEPLTLAASSTTHIWLRNVAGVGSIYTDTTGVGPPSGDFLKIWEVTTDATGVTGTVDRRVFSYDILADVIVDSLTSDDEVVAKRIELSRAEPYVELEDTVTGDIVRIWARGGNLEITDQAGTTIYSDAKSPTTLADAAPPNVAGSSAIGASEDAAREDHTHGHGVQAGGTTHAAAGASAGFMSAADKSKLDGIESGAQADMTGAEILAALAPVDGAGSGLDADTVDGLNPTSAATPSTVMARDGSGRTKVADPAADDDAANKRYVDGRASFNEILMLGGM